MKKITILLIILLIIYCSKNPIIEPIKEYITVPELVSFCNLPGKCGEVLAQENTEINIQGFIDSKNIFDKEHYPQLSYEKFIIHNSNKTHILEVFIINNNNSEIFKKIYKNQSTKPVFISAKIKGIDLPSKNGCERWIKLIIDNEKNISF